MGDVLTHDKVSPYWAKYVDGLKAYIFSRDGASDDMEKDLLLWHKWYGIEEDQVSVVHEYVTGDHFWGNLSEYQFFLGPNIPLVEEGDILSECAFLRSYQIQSLL